MQVTARDIEIINYLADNGGATIEQLTIYFPSYNMAAKRLKKLNDEKFIKSKIHPILGKKVYYIKKLPSYHRLILNDVYLQFKDKTQFFQREYKIANKIVDGILILKSGTIIIVEVDIYNRTKKEKLDAIYKALKATRKPFRIVIVEKAERAERKRGEEVEKNIVRVNVLYVKNLKKYVS